MASSRGSPRDLNARPAHLTRVLWKGRGRRSLYRYLRKHGEELAVAQPEAMFFSGFRSSLPSPLTSQGIVAVPDGQKPRYRCIPERVVPADSQNIVQMYAKNVLLSFAFLPIPSIFVVAPSNLLQCVYCRPMRKFSQGQSDGPPWLNGR